MTPAEAKIESRNIRKDIGPRAYLGISLNECNMDGALYAAVYPEGVTNTHAFTVYADDWAELFIRLRTKWAEHNVVFRARRVRAMALQIIAITADKGKCTDADLRASDFAADEVKLYSAEAVEDANKIADNGPFSIVKVRGANAA